MKNERAKLIAGSVVVIAAVLLIALFSSPRPSAPQASPAGVAPSQIAFPSDVPIRASGAVQSASGAIPNGQLQASISFVSTGTVGANFNFYKQFFSASDGWTFLSQANAPADPAHKAILARNGQGMLTVNISSQPPSASLIEMSFVGNPVAVK